ncbi:hypothetical protein RHRU231_30064 [Rhodococcus ruber]|uniref:Uncharacterized protein n=1 Tax=Rhodococcus ruber TaxID=1830 RepID=A0A098BIJ6_9NOCA|nr:hypothetical protein RHRU231_30064 [Rhodococcus ruber]
MGHRRHRIRQGRRRLAVCGPAVFRHLGQGRELSGRGQCARRHRHRVRTVGLAAVSARELGRSVLRRSGDGRGDHRPTAAERDSRPGAVSLQGGTRPRDARRTRLVGPDPAGGRRRRRLRRLGHFPSGSDRPRPGLRRRGQRCHPRAPGRGGPGRRRVFRPRPAADPTLPGGGDLQGAHRCCRSRGADRSDLASRNQDRPGQSESGDAFEVRGAAGTSGQPHHPPGRGRCPAAGLAARRMAPRCGAAHRLLAVHPARGHTPAGVGASGQDPLAHRARLSGTENRPRPRPFRGPLLARLAPPCHPGHRRASVPDHPAADRPKSVRAGLTLYGLVRELQRTLAYWIGTCPTCHHTFPT